MHFIDCPVFWLRDPADGAIGAWRRHGVQAEGKAPTQTSATIPARGIFSERDVKTARGGVWTHMQVAASKKCARKTPSGSPKTRPNTNGVHGPLRWCRRASITWPMLAPRRFCDRAP